MALLEFAKIVTEILAGEQPDGGTSADAGGAMYEEFGICAGVY